jgi:hypothetical protein
VRVGQLRAMAVGLHHKAHEDICQGLIEESRSSKLNRALLEGLWQRYCVCFDGWGGTGWVDPGFEVV